MKPSTLMTLILMTTAATSSPLLSAKAVAADAQAQAAALLSRPWTPVVPRAAAHSQAQDGIAQAAALLSRPQTEKFVIPPSRVSQPVVLVDGQTRAAALLSRPTRL